MQDAQQPQFPKSLEGRYKQPRFISAGGAGSVFAALDEHLYKQVAIKLLNVDSGEQKLLRFQQEAKAIAKFKHTNIVTALDFGLVDERIAYLVLDFVSDASLNTLIKEREAISVEKCLHIFRQICAGMSYAHARGVLHRDLKPSNVLLEDASSKHPVAKVADFGIAKISGPILVATTGNIFIGTPAYTSPEQFRGKEVDERADIYSLGCLMFTTLQGDTPFSGETTTELAFQHSNEPVPEIEVTYSGEKIPTSLQEIVEKCLDKEPEYRYSSFKEVDDLLAQVQKELIDADLQPLRKEQKLESSMESYSVSSSNPYMDTSASPPFQLKKGRPPYAIAMIATLAILTGLIIGRSFLGPAAIDDIGTIFNGTSTSKTAAIPPPVPHGLPLLDYDYDSQEEKLSESETKKPLKKLLEIGEAQMNMKEYSLANRYFNFVLQNQPDNLKALKMRSQSREWLGDKKGAVLDLSSALKLEPKDEKLIHKRAELRVDIGKLKDALEDYETFLTLEPDNFNGQKEHAKLCEDLSMKTKALEGYAKAIALKPDDASSYAKRGRIFQDLGDLKKALPEFDKALALEPKPDTYNDRARIYLSSNQYEKAIADYSKAIELADDKMFFYRARGEAYAKAGEKELSERDFEKVKSIEQLAGPVLPAEETYRDDR